MESTANVANKLLDILARLALHDCINTWSNYGASVSCLDDLACTATVDVLAQHNVARLGQGREIETVFIYN